MSGEKDSSYTEAFREFRMNISENDFHDDYPKTVEMTLAICSGLRYHYIRNYRSLTSDQSIQLIETFAKRHEKLKDYTHILHDYLYSPESIIMHSHWSDDTDPGFNAWVLLCHAYGLVTLTSEQQRTIYWHFAYKNSWVRRNVIQLKLLDRDIKRRIELQQKLNEMGKLVNNIDEFNHIYKCTVPSTESRTGMRTYEYTIDSYYDGLVDERLGTDTIYEWILNDDIDNFQQWYNNGGLRQYDNAPRNKDKSLEYRENIAAHILSSNAVKIIRFIIMNDLHEFLDKIDGMWALMDPWRYPVNDPECFKILQERFRKEHENIILDFVNTGYDNDHSMVGYVYRFIRPEIAESIYHEIMEISIRLYGTEDIYLQLYVAIEMTKFGHIGPIESLDWDIITKTLSDKNNNAIKAEYLVLKLVHFMRYRRNLITELCECLPFGMNPSTALYIRDLFSENGLVRIALPEQLLDKYEEELLIVFINSKNQVVMIDLEEEEEWICTLDELFL